jgi:uncharacterized protein with FMN-binding domain
MRRIVMAVMGTVSGVVLLFSYHTSTRSTLAVGAGAASGTTIPGTVPSSAPTSAPSPTTTAPTPAPSSGSSSSSSSPAKVSGTFTGDPASTRWGTVQVRITVQNGRITSSAAVQYPQNNGRDLEINSYALPQLAQEAVQAQSANIDAISGATVTSGGYIQSLQSAVDQAHL